MNNIHIINRIFNLLQRYLHKSYARADVDDLDVDDIAKVDSYHGPPKPTFLEVFMVNYLVFRWPKGPKPLFFMVLGGSWLFVHVGSLQFRSKAQGLMGSVADAKNSIQKAIPVNFSSAKLPAP